VARKSGGLGLGLSIVRHLVAAHGGEVSAFSEGEGKGAVFTVTLPIVDRPRKGERSQRSMSQPVEPPPGLEGIHILVVDDEADTREYVRMLLQACKVRVSEASTASEALDALKRDRPDLLLSDIGMPEEDGYLLTQRVRKLSESEGGRTPAVAGQTRPATT
jgi:PleD family two-component response regulator